MQMSTEHDTPENNNTHIGSELGKNPSNPKPLSFSLCSLISICGDCMGILIKKDALLLSPFSTRKFWTGSWSAPPTPQLGLGFRPQGVGF